MFIIQDDTTSSSNMIVDDHQPVASPMLDIIMDKCSNDDILGASLRSRIVSHHDTTAANDAPHLIASCSSTSDDDESITGHSYTNIEYKYHIEPRILGTGHNGSVRECIDRRTGQRYAVKSLSKKDPNVKPGGLVREITLLQEMKNDNIINLVDIIEEEDYVHLVTDLCTGGELFDKIVEKSEEDNGSPCFREDEAARIMHQLLTAVSYMHKKNVAHRDIKPENILLQTNDQDSPVKIIDFGLSRKHSTKRNGPMSTVVGTPYYIAPEVLRKSYDKTCDLWSVGVIAYIILCGYPPFNGRNNKETHASVMKGRYSFPAEDWQDISRDAMDFIYRLLQMDPRRRMSAEQALHHPWIVKHTEAPLSAAVVAAAAPPTSQPEDVCMAEVEVVHHHQHHQQQHQHHQQQQPPITLGISHYLDHTTRKAVSVSPSPSRRKVCMSKFYH